MAGWEVADVQEGAGVADEGMRLALREEADRDATLGDVAGERFKSLVEPSGSRISRVPSMRAASL